MTFATNQMSIMLDQVELIRRVGEDNQNFHVVAPSFLANISLTGSILRLA